MPLWIQPRMVLAGRRMPALAHSRLGWAGVPVTSVSASRSSSASATCHLPIVLLQCLFDRFGSVFPQCGLMVFPGAVIVSR